MLRTLKRRLSLRPRRASSDKGAAVVEFALIATLFFLLVSLVIQGTFIFGAWLIITNAVREGARMGVPCIGRGVEECYPMPADGSPNVHDWVVTMAQGIERDQLVVDVAVNDGFLYVWAAYPVPVVAPFVAEMMPDGITVVADSVMRLENAGGIALFTPTPDLGIPTATATSTPGAGLPTPTATSTPDPSVPTATPTETPIPTATNTPTPTATNTPTPTATDTPVPTATRTPCARPHPTDPDKCLGGPGG